MSYDEFLNWIAYFELEPFGEERADLRSGVIAATIANVYRDPKKQKKAFEPADFMPKFEQPKQETDWRVMRERLRMAAAAANRTR